LSFLRGLIPENGLQGTEHIESVHHGKRENHTEKDFWKLCQASETIDNGNKEGQEHSPGSFHGSKAIIRTSWRKDMNVILLEHIDDLGTVGQTVKVKDGYARNYLLPRKLACTATDKNLNYYRTLIESKLKKLAKAKGAAELQAEKLSALTLNFLRKSKDQDARLFGSVTSGDVAAALEAQGFEIDRKRISLSEPIKKLGEYKAAVRLHPEVVTNINIVVKLEDEGENVV